MSQVSVLFFATARDLAGVSRIELEIPVHVLVSELRSILAVRFPLLEPVIGQMLVAVNRQFALDDELVADGAEVAVFPPVSGGSGKVTICELTDAVLDPNRIVQRLSNPSVGAVVMFTGIVRATSARDAGKETIALDYQAYAHMANEKLAQIADEIRSRWPEVYGIALIQRIGYQAVGEISVVVACSSAHRDDGVFDAARYGIDRLKEIVPVWKKDIYADGSEWIEGTYVPQGGE